MNLGDLFLTIGLKGNEKTISALKDTKVQISDIGSNALAAKAAIIGMMYGLERLMSNSAATGNGLLQFATYTGLSADALQKWQFAARQAGVTSDELTGSVKGVQDQMINMLLGKSHPEGFSLVANKVGLDQNRLRDTFYVLGQLQKYAQVVPADIGNIALKSFGITEGTINAMRRGMFNEKVFAKAPLYSQGEIGTLSKVGVEWSNLGQRIEMAMGHLTSKHGLKLVGEISQITTQILKLVDALTTLAEKIKIFELIGMAFQGWGMILGLITDGLDKMGKASGSSNGAKDKNSYSSLGPKKFIDSMLQNVMNDYFNSYGPKVTAIAQSPSVQPTAQTTANIVVHNHGVQDAKDGAHHVKKAVQDAFRQNQANSQGG